MTEPQRDDDAETTPEVDLDESEPDEYEPVGPSSKAGRSLTIPALVIALAIIVYVIFFVLTR